MTWQWEVEAPARTMRSGEELGRRPKAEVLPPTMSSNLYGSALLSRLDPAARPRALTRPRTAALDNSDDQPWAADASPQDVVSTAIAREKLTR